MRSSLASAGAADLARELTKAGLKVVGLERGSKRTPRGTFTIPAVRDELKYAVRQELFLDPSARNPVDAAFAGGDRAAVPPFRLFPAGHRSRWRRRDLERHDVAVDAVRSQAALHISRNAMAKMRSRRNDDQDLPACYDELEPYYDKFEKLCGTSGKAGNLRGKMIDGGNIFEGPRQIEYPNPPLAPSMPGPCWTRPAKHGLSSFQAPSGNPSRDLHQPRGLGARACEFCGHCERIGCAANAKACPNSHPAGAAGGPEIRVAHHAQVKERIYDKDAHKVTRCATSIHRSGEESSNPPVS